MALRPDERREQKNAAARARYAADPEKHRARSRVACRAYRADPEKKKLAVQRSVDSLRRRTTGVDSVQYARMVADQAGLCAICGEPPQGRELDVDHDHATGRVRKLLCGSCNLGLGKFRDDPTLLLSAHLYLMTAEG